MSSEQTFSNADLRATAQDYKRDHTHKAKWALGATDGVGRAEGKPRPVRTSETEYNRARRSNKSAIASLAHSAKVSRKHDMLEGTDESSSSSAASNSADSAPPSPPAEEADVKYSYDAFRSPTQGSQILNVALAKAVEKFEDRETARIVKSEYELVDEDGESVRQSPEKKRKGKGVKGEGMVVLRNADEEEYEFV